LLSFSRFNSEEDGIQTGKQTWDNLCSTLVEMGQPVIISPPSKDSSTQHQLYQEFMHAHEHRSVDLVKDLFVLLPSSAVRPFQQRNLLVSRLSGLDSGLRAFTKPNQSGKCRIGCIDHAHFQGELQLFPRSFSAFLTRHLDSGVQDRAI
jgi:hypothetical protein